MTINHDDMRRAQAAQVAAALKLIADSDDVTVMQAVDQDRESALQTWSILQGYIGHKQPSIFGPPQRAEWKEIKDEDCQDRRMWAVVDDGTDLYVIEEAPAMYYVILRWDARQPNADGYSNEKGEWCWNPDTTISGPFPTLDGARAAYLIAAATYHPED